MSQHDQSTDEFPAENPPRTDELRERVQALNEKAGDLAETLQHIEDRLSEALGQDPEKRAVD